MKSQKLARTNVALRLAIVASERSQRQIARRLRMDETRLSRIVRGQETARPKEREKLARLLQRSILELFPAAPESVAS